MKHWWSVTGFRRAISGTTPSLDITLRGWDLASLAFSPGPITDDHLTHPAGMDVARIYAIVAGSLFAILTTLNFCIHLCTILQTYTVWIVRHIVHHFILRRHRQVGPWSLRSFILRCIYILTDIFCSAYRIRSMVEAGKRTGVLLLINLMPLYLGPHLDFLAEFLGISLHDLHTVHGSTTVLLSAAYALFSGFGGQWNALAWSPHPYTLIVRLIHCSCRMLLRTIRASRH